MAVADPEYPRFVPMGDCALVVEFGESRHPELSARMAAIARSLRASPLPGVRDVVPTFNTIAVHYDPTGVEAGESPYETLAARIKQRLDAGLEDEAVPGRLVEIPVCYGGDKGEDLEALAGHHGLSPEDVVRLHSAPEYHVHMLGFVPGFAYLGGLDPRLATPRRASPRPRVPAGSVAIGGDSTGIFPLETPGGWHLLGRTPLRLFVPEATPPCLLNAGDRVRFVPIDAGQFEALVVQAA